MENSRTVALNTLAQYMGKAVAVFTSILVTTVLTRSLGVSSYGSYVLVMNLVMFANAIAEWGMTFIATREASKQNEEEWFEAVLWSRFGSSLLTAVVLGVFWSRWQSSIEWVVILIAMSLVVILSFKSWLQVIFQTQMSLWKLMVVDTLTTLGFGMMVVWLSVSGVINLTSVVSALLGVTISGVVLGVVFVLHTKYRPGFGVKPRILSKLWRESLVMGAVLVVFSVYNKIDVFILRYYRGEYEVGIYGLAYKIYENVVIGAAFFANSVFPVLARKAGKILAFRKVLSRMLLVLGVSGLGLALVTWTLAPVMIRVLGGDSYLGAVGAVRWLTLAVVFAFLNHGLGYATIALGKQKVSALIACVGLVVNLVANFGLVPSYGFMAAAFATGVTEGAVFLLTGVYLARKVFNRF